MTQFAALGHLTSPVITIDGPTASGKGTVASTLASRLGFHVLDSGALYRLAAMIVIGEMISLWGTDWEVGHRSEIDAAVASLMDTRGEDIALQVLKLQPRFSAGSVILADDRDVGALLRQEAVGRMASRVAVNAHLRQRLVAAQRAFAMPPGLVADGRDMGSVIFPDATLKVYLTASVVARAQRRYAQLKAKGECVNIADLERDLQERDARDMNRPCAPLVCPKGAITIDSSNLGVDEVVERLLTLVDQVGIGSEDEADLSM